MGAQGGSTGMDWSHHHEFVFDALNPGVEPVQLQVNIYDPQTVFTGAPVPCTAFIKSFTLEPGHSEPIRIPTILTNEPCPAEVATPRKTTSLIRETVIAVSFMPDKPVIIDDLRLE
jgi:hypothetical protein